MNAVIKKQSLGQFFTSNADYIFQGLEKYVNEKIVCDPFAGGQDLMNWSRENRAKKIYGYDVDSSYVDKRVKLNDSILRPPKYDFIVTNPPYLNVNKANQETKEKYFKHSGLEDLYQLSLRALLNSQEGIIIVPINFLSAENSKKIRGLFFNKFKIIKMNYFRQQVFPDTTYNVIAFYYKQWRPNEGRESFTIKTKIFPQKEKVLIKLDKKYDWMIGGEFLQIIREQENSLGIKRLVETDLVNGSKEIRAAYNHILQLKKFNVEKSFYNFVKSNILLLRAIDSGTAEGKIRLENIKDYNVDCLISKTTSRNMVQLLFRSPMPENDQLKLMHSFNREIDKLRSDYLSLFLTNFRDNDRKRISFDFVYKFLNYLYYVEVKSSSHCMVKPVSLFNNLDLKMV